MKNKKKKIQLLAFYMHLKYSVNQQVGLVDLGSPFAVLVFLRECQLSICIASLCFSSFLIFVFCCNIHHFCVLFGSPAIAWHPVHETLFTSGGSDGSMFFWLVGWVFVSQIWTLSYIATLITEMSFRNFSK